MQLSFLLLAICLAVSSQARLLHKSNTLLSMPLRRTSNSRTNVHPLINLQRQINHSAQRLARITGRALPREELERSMHKRVLSVEGLEGLHKRCSRAGGLVKIDVCENSSTNKSVNLFLDDPLEDTAYTMTLEIGSPPQKFILLVDTGSADLWVCGEGCQSEGGGDCGEHTCLGGNSSSSFVDAGGSFDLSFGDGSHVVGHLARDTVRVAGLTLKGHTFGVALQESEGLVNNTISPYDGILGFGSFNLSQERVPTVVESMASAGLISSAVVSFKLSRLSDGANDGEITFGGLDYTKFDPETLVTVPNINLKGFWETFIPNITVNGVDTGMRNRTGILDTGAAVLSIPAGDSQIIHGLIKGAKSDGQGGFTVPCTFQDSLALTIGGQSFTIDPRDIATTPVNSSDPQGDCASGILSASISDADPPNQWLVGDVFLKNAYFSTDISNNTLSLAKLT